MQIKIAVITAASLASFIVVMPAFATDAMTTSTTANTTNGTWASPKPSGMRGDMKIDRTEIQGDRVKIAGMHSDILTKSCAAIETNAANLIAKIQVRITAAQGEGKDITAAVAAVTAANTDLANGKTYCDQAVAKFNSVPADKWSEQHPVFLEARALAKQAKESFLKARQDLMAAVKAIHGLGLPKAAAKPAASPTVQQ